MTTIPYTSGGLSAKLALLFAALALSACAGLKKQPAAAAVSSLPNPQVLLLGEVHDNPQGHRERFDDLKRRVEAGWRPAIAMEQFDQENQHLLNRAMKDCADPECVIRVMEGPGWNWALYRPVIDLALTYRLPLIAANLSRADASRTVRDGIKATFDAVALDAYRLNAPLPADIRAGQQKEIIAGHCNMLPESMVGGMVDAQVARDIWMAKLIRAQAPRDVVLLAGNNHVRKDVGAARWLRDTAPALIIRSEAYLEKTLDGDQAAFDVIHLVQPHERPDPCAKFKTRS